MRILGVSALVLWGLMTTLAVQAQTSPTAVEVPAAEAKIQLPVAVAPQAADETAQVPQVEPTPPAADAVPAPQEPAPTPIPPAEEPPLLTLPHDPAKVDAQLVPAPTQKELEEARSQLKEKDALIAKLQKHLESALVRLNRVQTPVAENTSLAALKAAQQKLQKQNDLLKARQQELLAQNEELMRKKQVLDLENRQLFQALNERSTSDAPGSQVAGKVSKDNAQKWAMEAR